MDKDYKSPIDGRDIAIQQYMCELVIQRKAHKQKQVLPDKFWNLPEWKPEYRKQIIRANSLLKAFDPICIIRALKSSRGQYIYSLLFPGLPAMIEQEQIKIDKENEIAKKSKKIETVETTSKPSKQFGKKSKINKLRGLE